MDESLRCCGYRGDWACEDEYPDHIVPIRNFGLDNSSGDGHFSMCKACCKTRDSIRNPTRERHPVTGKFKMDWKTAKAIELGGDIKNRHTPEWKSYLDGAEVMWGLEIKGAIIKAGTYFAPGEVGLMTGRGIGLPKFKSKKPKFNQGQYKSSLTTPRDSTKEVEPKEGPGFVYIFEDGMKKPGFIKVGATEVVDQRLQAGNTWGAFTCLYTKEFKRRFEAEAKIFELLEDYRLYRDKEWFKVNTDLAIKTIEGMYEVQ